MADLSVKPNANAKSELPKESFSELFDRIAILAPEFVKKQLPDAAKFVRKSNAPTSSENRSENQDNGFEPKESKPESAEPRTKSPDQIPLQLQLQNNQAQFFIDQHIPVMRELRAIVNELVEWQRLNRPNSWAIKVKDFPLRLKIERVEGKLNLTIFADGQLKQELSEYKNEIAALLKKKEIDLHQLDVLELKDYATLIDQESQPDSQDRRQSSDEQGILEDNNDIDTK